MEVLPLNIVQQRLHNLSTAATRTVDVAAIIQTVPSTFTPEEVELLTSYKTPRVTDDGTCSLPNDLDPEPFQVYNKLLEHHAVSSSSTTANTTNDDVDESIKLLELQRLWILRQICQQLATATNSLLFFA